MRAAYNRTKYRPQRIELMQDWADLLDEFRNFRLPECRLKRGPRRADLSLVHRGAPW